MPAAVNGFKVCSKCRVEKSVNEFNKDKNTVDGLFTWCKLCSAAHTTAYYQANRERELTKSASYRQNNWLVYINHYGGHCVDCNLDLTQCPSVVHFHHRDPSTKEAEPKKLIGNNKPFNDVIYECDKCDMLCANCHRLKHLKPFNKLAANSKIYRRYKQEVVNHYGDNCTECSETYDPSIMQFHHRDKTTKEHTPSKLIESEWNSDKALVLSELDKCDLVCPNCHAQETAHRQDEPNWFTLVEHKGAIEPTKQQMNTNQLISRG